MQAKNPHLQGDIDNIERIQRRATRIPTGFEKFEYEDRLKKLSITTLKDRRIRGDLIEMYKVMSSRESIDGGETSKSEKKRGYIWTSGECAWEQSKYAQRVL